MVVRAGWCNTGNALLELADVGIDSEIKDSVRSAAIKGLATETFAAGSLSGRDIEVREIQGTKAGQSYLVEVELALPATLAIQETRPIEDTVRERIGGKVRGIRRVKVKFVAKNDDMVDFTEEFIGADVSPNSSPEPEEAHEHSHDHSHANGHSHGKNNSDKMKRR